MRNVLIIAYYFPPMGLSGVQRTMKFVKYLPEFGWNPIVLTTNSKNYYAYDESLINELGENIKIYRTEKDVPFANSKENSSAKSLYYPSKFKQKIMRVISQTLFQPDSRKFWLKHALKTAETIFAENKIDLILATAPPFTSFLVASELSKKFNIPYVMDYRDLWVDNAYYFWATTFHKSYSIKLEKELLTHSEKAIVISRKMKEMLISRYKFLTYDDVSIIPHGFDKEDFEQMRLVQKPKNKFIITHSGLFPDDLTPKYFLKALANFLKNNPETANYVEAKFVGLMRKAHVKLISKYKLNQNVTLMGYLEHKESVKQIMESDVLWMMIPNDIATPSRFYEYIGAGKAMIISCPEGNLRQRAKESGVAITTDVKNIKEIESAIFELYQNWKNDKLPLPNQAFIEKYERKALTAQLARELSFASSNVI